jgi:hypothetical protein
MIQRIFYDANILIDLVNADNILNRTVTLLTSRLVANKQVLLCSPLSFAITYYFLGKKIKDQHFLNDKMKQVFSLFRFTQENEGTMQQVIQSTFTDLEDAIQYYSASEAKAEVIITQNHYDFRIQLFLFTTLCIFGK